MSYSNGKLPEETISHDKIIEIVKGLPGVGFKLTDDGDYDIDNKKLRNVASPQTNNDASTKSYVDVEVSKTLKLDGSSAMTGALDMDNRRIENIGAGRHNTADALTHLQLEAFYLDLNTETGDIEVQNPIDMQNQRIKGLVEPVHHKDATTKFYVDNFMTQKADKTELSNYLKKDGTVSLTGNLDIGGNKITNLKKASSGNDAVNWTQMLDEIGKYLHESGGTMTGDIDLNGNSIYNIQNVDNNTSAVNRGYVDTGLASKANINQVILRDGSQDMTGNLNMSQKKIINCGPPSGQFDVTRKSYVDNQFSRCLRLDGSNKMTSNLDMNNLQIRNVKDATNNQDCVTLKQVNDGLSTTSINVNKYTDQKIAESITTHENRKNVLKYAMDDGEFTEDFGIQDVNLITYNDSPHKTNKKAFSLKVQKTTDGSSLFKGRFDFNLFKMIRDDFSDKYTVCIEVYFEKDGRHDSEINSFNITFEKLNMNIDKSHTIKINTDYKYYRSILNLSPDGTSPSIQRRLYVNVQSSFDNLSPSLLPLHVLIYGIKDEAKNDIYFTIYDYEKGYEVSNNNLQIHIPINMNNNGIMGLPRSPIDDNGPLTRTYMRLVSFPCLLVGTSEIGVNNYHFSYELQIDGTTTNIKLASILGANSLHILNVRVTSNTILNGLYSLIFNDRSYPTFAYNVNTIIYNINRSFHGFNLIQMKSTDNVRRRFMYTIFYRPYNF